MAALESGCSVVRATRDFSPSMYVEISFESCRCFKMSPGSGCESGKIPQIQCQLLKMTNRRMRLLVKQAA